MTKSTKSTQAARRSVAVRADITFIALSDDGLPCVLPTTLSYLPDDPFAVTMTFNVADSSVSWSYSRELLIAGQHSPAGHGDVCVWPAEDANGEPIVFIRLSSPDGELTIHAPANAIALFCHRMLTAVPLGEETEQIDIGAALHALIAD